MNRTVKSGPVTQSEPSRMNGDPPPGLQGSLTFPLRTNVSFIIGIGYFINDCSHEGLFCLINCIRKARICSQGPIRR